MRRDQKGTGLIILWEFTGWRGTYTCPAAFPWPPGFTALLDILSSLVATLTDRTGPLAPASPLSSITLRRRAASDWIAHTPKNCRETNHTRIWNQVQEWLQHIQLACYGLWVMGKMHVKCINHRGVCTIHTIFDSKQSVFMVKYKDCIKKSVFNFSTE